MTDEQNQQQMEERQMQEENTRLCELNIYQRMHAIMEDLKYIQKDEKKVANQYRAVTHDAVTAKVHDMLVKHRVYSAVSVIDHSQDGNRTEVNIGITYVNIDNPEDVVVIRSFGYGIDSQDKGPGKAISYAVKYNYLKAFALETGDDPDNDQGNQFDHVTELAEAVKKHQDTITVIQEGIANNDYSSAAEAWWELTQDEQKSLWTATTKGGPFTTEERRVMKTSEFRQAHFGSEK